MLVASAGPTVTGELVVRTHYSSTASCLMYDTEHENVDGSSSARVDSAAAATGLFQEAFDALPHPAPFAGVTDSEADSCTAALATNDLAAVIGFYRRELPAKGWTITEDTPERLTATSAGLTFSVSSAEGAQPGTSPEVRIGSRTQ